MSFLILLLCHCFFYIGEVFDPLGLDGTIVVHEIMHGITQFTSNLIYRGESGAGNEADERHFCRGRRSTGGCICY